MDVRFLRRVNVARAKRTVIVAAVLGTSCASVARAACDEAPYRQFDFWLGRWEVFLPDGRKAGENVIESVAGGCALVESWSGRGGLTGKSVNAYDREDARWHQTWVDSGGERLVLVGSWRDGSMVLATDASDGRPRKRTDRITWTPRPDGRVRQLWEYSEDAGTTWQVAFDGLYARAR